MKSIPLIRVNAFLPFLTFLKRLGSPLERWLDQENLSPLALNDPESLIPRNLVFSFLERAARSEGLENLGLLVGKETSIAALGTFGRLILGSPTLYDAFNTIQTLAPANNSGEIYWLAEQGEKVLFCQRYIDSPGSICQYAAHFSLILMMELLGLVAGEEWRPKEIYLQTGQKSDLATSELFSDAKIQTDEEFSAIVFPRFFLSLPLKTPRFFLEEQRQQDIAFLRSSSPAGNLGESWRQAIASLPRGNYPDIHFAAAMAGTSVRTLQRRLEKEGLTYSELVERTRFEEAIRLLQEPSIKLAGISAELGYTDAAHFTRAFKRWTGLSPSQFRRREAVRAGSLNQFLKS